MQFFNGSRLIKEQFSKASRCFTFADANDEEAEAVCLNTECTAEGVMFKVDESADANATLCPFDQRVWFSRRGCIVAVSVGDAT
jgi:hypothetical protein